MIFAAMLPEFDKMYFCDREEASAAAPLRKRSRQEAEEDLYIAEIDARASTAADRARIDVRTAQAAVERTELENMQFRLQLQKQEQQLRERADISS